MWDVPFDHTDLGNWVVQSRGMQLFQKKKPRRGNNNNDDFDEEQLVMTEVYFMLSFLSDKDPLKILHWVAGEWGKIGGKKLYVKEVLLFNMQSVVNIFHMRNGNTFDTILAEFKMILTKAKEISE